MCNVLPWVRRCVVWPVETFAEIQNVRLIKVVNADGIRNVIHGISGDIVDSTLDCVAQVREKTTVSIACVEQISLTNSRYIDLRKTSVTIAKTSHEHPTVAKSAFCKKPGLEPANRQSNDRTSAASAQSAGKIAKKRIL